jgi:hypothetical protein
MDANPVFEDKKGFVKNLSLLNDLNVNVRLCFDLDGTICPAVAEEDFLTVEPFVGAKEVLKTLKESGHTVIIYTARDPKWKSITEFWLQDKGIPCDELIMGKPFANIYIDNKGYRFTRWSDIIEQFMISPHKQGVI